ncbi:hypothetical protein TWF481_009613 [Arthrobotrys musiformis]|uniref:Uncharacterized protein n=1 Tax=Arthrobotrys musiformis TaxID=47236 RepID=A0AAV9W5D7_9PEZI
MYIVVLIKETMVQAGDSGDSGDRDGDGDDVVDRKERNGEAEEQEEEDGDGDTAPPANFWTKCERKRNEQTATATATAALTWPGLLSGWLSSQNKSKITGKCVSPLSKSPDQRRRTQRKTGVRRLFAFLAFRNGSTFFFLWFRSVLSLAAEALSMGSQGQARSKTYSYPLCNVVSVNFGLGLV